MEKIEIKLKLNCSSDVTMIEITKQLFNNEFLSDIQFHIGGKVLFAHSLELMKRSSVFQKQLMLNIGGNKLISLDDVKYDSFYQFIQFIYTDEYNIVNTEMGIDVLKLAIKYQVLRLENKLIDWLSLKPHCLRLYEFCIMENYRVPYNRVKSKVADSLSDCLEGDSFELIHTDVVVEILNFDYVDKRVTEIRLFDAVIQWINKFRENNEISLENKQNAIDRVLRLIRFPTMELTEFASCVPKLDSLLSEIDYGIIFKLIVGHPKLNNTKWNSIPRNDFSWRLVHHCWHNGNKPPVTNFTVTNEVLLIGVRLDLPNFKNKQLQLSALNIKTQMIEVLTFRCYRSEYFCCSLSSFGDSVLLKPNYEYTIKYLYSQDDKFRMRTETNEIIITDPSKSVQIQNAGRDIFELIFKNPSF